MQVNSMRPPFAATQLDRSAENAKGGKPEGKPGAVVTREVTVGEDGSRTTVKSIELPNGKTFTSERVFTRTDAGVTIHTEKTVPSGRHIVIDVTITNGVDEPETEPDEEAEAPTDPVAETPAETPTDSPEETPTDPIAEAPAETPDVTPAEETPEETPADPVADAPVETPVETPDETASIPVPEVTGEVTGETAVDALLDAMQEEAAAA